jgi:hypothetical protein
VPSTGGSYSWSDWGLRSANKHLLAVGWLWPRGPEKSSDSAGWNVMEWVQLVYWSLVPWVEARRIELFGVGLAAELWELGISSWGDLFLLLLPFPLVWLFWRGVRSWGNLGWCWGLVLKCYELRTRQHKVLNVNALRPPKHYLPKDLMNFGRRPWAKYHEGHTFVIRIIESVQDEAYEYKILKKDISKTDNIICFLIIWTWISKHNI